MSRPVLVTPSSLDKLVVVHLPHISVEVDHHPCIALRQRMAAADAVVRFQTGFLDTHLVADVQRFDLKAQRQTSSLQVVAVGLGLPQTQ